MPRAFRRSFANIARPATYIAFGAAALVFCVSGLGCDGCGLIRAGLRQSREREDSAKKANCNRGGFDLHRGLPPLFYPMMTLFFRAADALDRSGAARRIISGNHHAVQLNSVPRS